MESSLTKRKALERIFVFQAVEYGYLTQDQLIDCIQEHDKCEPPVPLLTICKQKGLLSPSQVNHLMSKRLDASVAKAFVQGFRQKEQVETKVEEAPGVPPTGTFTKVLPREEREEYERLLAEKDKLLSREQKQREYLRRKLEDLERKQSNYEREKRELLDKKQREVETLESELTCYKGLHEQSEEQLRQAESNLQEKVQMLEREKQKARSLFNLVSQGGEELRESEENRRLAEANLEKERTELEYIKKKLDKEAQEKEALKKNFQDAEDEVSRLRKEMESITESSSTVQYELDSLKGEKERLGTDLAAAVQEAQGSQSLNDKIQELQNKIDAKSQEELKLIEEKKKLDQKNQELEEQLRQEMRKLKDEFEAEKAELEEEHHKAKVSLQTDLTQYKQKSESLESKLQQYQESLQNWDEMDKQREQLKKQIEEEYQKRKEAEKEKAAVEVQLKETEQRLERLRQIYVEGEMESGTVLPGSNGEFYTIQKILGRGGMGIAYTAERTSDNEIVVVKTLLAEGMSDMKVLMRFVQEARTLLAFDHKNLVQGYDYYQGRDLSYFVMEFLSGISVEEMLEEQGVLDTVEATEMVMGIARALQYMEENNLVHRDVKPANIIYTEDKIAKLVDFGIVKMTDRRCSLTTDGIILGTPYYLSPEQTYQTDVDIRSDIYSLGATYYHMVVGEVPFPGDNPIDVIQKRLVKSPKPGKVNPDLPKHVCNIIEKMMNKAQKKRHNSAAELVSDLEVVLAKIRR